VQAQAQTRGGDRGPSLRSGHEAQRSGSTSRTAMSRSARLARKGSCRVPSGARRTGSVSVTMGRARPAKRDDAVTLGEFRRRLRTASVGVGSAPGGTGSAPPERALRHERVVLPDLRSGHPCVWDRVMLSPLSEHRDALAAVRIRRREERRVLGPAHRVFAGLLDQEGDDLTDVDLACKRGARATHRDRSRSFHSDYPPSRDSEIMVRVIRRRAGAPRPRRIRRKFARDRTSPGPVGVWHVTCEAAIGRGQRGSTLVVVGDSP